MLRWPYTASPYPRQVAKERHDSLRHFDYRPTNKVAVWINQGDIILLSLREYQDGKGDVLMKYSADEARSLKAYGELPENAKINETDTYGDETNEGIGFEFDEDRSGSEASDVDIEDI